MAYQAHVWGGEIDPYTIRFDPQSIDVSPVYNARYYDMFGVYHPAKLARDLVAFFTPPEYFKNALKYDEVLISLRTYRDARGPGVMIFNIFRDHYGVLSMRYLTHLACYAVLKEAGDVESIVNPTNSTMDWPSLSEAMASKALYLASKKRTWKDFRATLTSPAFVSRGAEAGFYSGLCLEMLWTARDSLLKLCVRGVLPGCSLLVLAAIQFLQDLAYRLYLVGSRWDQQIMQLICVDSFKEKSSLRNGDKNRFVSAEDSQLLSEAYSSLYHAWSQDKSYYAKVPLALMKNMTDLVLDTTNYNPSATEQERLGVNKVVSYVGTREFVASAFCLLVATNQEIKSKEGQLKLAHIISEAEILSLAGRIALSFTTEKKHVLQTDESLEGFTLGVCGFSEMLQESAKIVPELFHDSKIEWAKVLLRLWPWFHGVKLQLERMPEVYDRIAGIVAMWKSCEDFFRSNVDESRKCVAGSCIAILFANAFTGL
ncbi:hypothetical protein RhiJN_23221 [Ceratobasidium sp. AG-Ba]|nr:hypothetical protein RhiJN_23221 [Ceratobasidium sp. AG-Ba]